jgi:hypothetical protein
MHLAFVTLFALQAAVLLAQNLKIEEPAVITVQFESEDTVTFKGSQRVVTDIDLRVRGSEYTVPLQCAGGLHDVHAETAEMHIGTEAQAREGTFSLLFDIGNEQDRRFGKLPRIQISLYRRRLIAMLVTNMTGPQSGFSSNLCSTLPVGPVTCKDTRQLQGLAPELLVQQLRDLPVPIPSGVAASSSEAETRRRNIYEELLDWGTKSIPPLVRGISDPDLRLRRNAVLALGVLSGGWWRFECGPAKVDIAPALPALLIALSDPDVRGWAAQAVGNIGANAAAAVPALIELLKSTDVGTRNSACIALGQIGPSARAALPALRVTVSDTNPATRSFAARAIQRIEQH